MAVWLTAELFQFIRLTDGENSASQVYVGPISGGAGFLCGPSKRPVLAVVYGRRSDPTVTMPGKDGDPAERADDLRQVSVGQLTERTLGADPGVA